jgi:riboflavin synthase
MFTGIVEEVGSVVRVERRGLFQRLTITASLVLEGMSVGDSINIDGACQTVVTRDASTFTVESVEETLRRTTLGGLRPGDRVNLERSLRFDGRLGGHFVTGHVDGVGEVVGIRELSGSTFVTIRVPEGLERYIVEKGSIAVDGISLTVTAVGGDRFSVAIIPHTETVTTFDALRPGRRVNVEVDMLAKYIDKLLAAHNRGGGGLTEKRLWELGYGG